MPNNYNSKLAKFSETASTDMQINGLRLIYLMAAEVSREIQARKQSKAPPKTRTYLTFLYIQTLFQKGPGKQRLTAKGKERDLMRSEGSKVTIGNFFKH